MAAEVPEVAGKGGRRRTTWPKGNGAGIGGPARGTEPRKPAGRPKGVKNGEGKHARSVGLCRPLVPAAVDVWASVMADPEAPHMARIHAAQRIIERAEGAMPQRVDVRADVDLDRLTDVELAATIAARLGGRAGEAEGDPE